MDDGPNVLTVSMSQSLFEPLFYAVKGLCHPNILGTPNEFGRLYDGL